MNCIKSLRWLLLAAILLVAVVGRSQSVISFGNSFKLPSSVIANSTLNDTIFISNTDSGTFSGTVTIQLSVNGGTSFAFDSGIASSAGISFDTTGNASIAVIIPPFQSIFEAVIVHFDTSKFTAGPSVVVIWPILSNVTSGNAAVGDTLIDSITVLQPAGIAGPSPVGLKVYTDGAQLFITCAEPNALQHVRIFDVTGTLVAEQNLSASNSIPMSRDSDGIYLAELTLTSGQQVTYKIFKGK